jgi:hypothetical protein
MQRCETDRIKAVTSVLRSFQASISAFNKFIASSSDNVTGALELIRPERDILGIIESRRWVVTCSFFRAQTDAVSYGRTGPFQPRPTAYHSHYSEPSLHNFGIDLRKFDETNTSTSRVPPIVSFLLEYITEVSAALPDAGESIRSHLATSNLTIQPWDRATQDLALRDSSLSTTPPPTSPQSTRSVGSQGR